MQFGASGENLDNTELLAKYTVSHTMKKCPQSSANSEGCTSAKSDKNLCFLSNR